MHTYAQRLLDSQLDSHTIVFVVRVGDKKGSKCHGDGCKLPLIKVTGNKHWTNHIAKHHAPKKVAPAKVTSSAARGAKAPAPPATTGAISSWFDRAREAGKAQSKAIQSQYYLA